MCNWTRTSINKCVWTTLQCIIDFRDKVVIYKTCRFEVQTIWFLNVIVSSSTIVKQIDSKFCILKTIFNLLPFDFICFTNSLFLYITVTVSSFRTRFLVNILISCHFVLVWDSVIWFPPIFFFYRVLSIKLSLYRS